MLLTELPTDILVLLPAHLDSIDDLYALVSTCRTLYNACNDANVKLKPDLRRRDGQYLFQPHPHLLIAGTARQLGDWAVLSSENRDTFHGAVRKGVTGLLQLCASVARMSLTDMRRLHEIKYSVLNPLCRAVDLEAHQGDDSDEPEDGSADSGYKMTELEHPDLCILNTWIYSDLFRHTILASYQDVNVAAPFDNEVRYDYLKYCIPDENAMSLDLSSDIVQYAGNLIQERSELCFQQLDVLQLRSTSFSANQICKQLFPGSSNSIDTDQGWHELWVADIVLHSGLLALQYVLTYAGTDAATSNRIMLFNEDSVKSGLASLRAAMDKSRADGTLRRISDDDHQISTWSSLSEDIELLWYRAGISQ